MSTSQPCLGDNPLIPPPNTKISSHSASLSRSSIGNAAPAYELDPLLRSLSPEATLQALSSTDAVPKNEKSAHDILSRSISQVSPADRALGIRAAVAAKNLTLWYKEVQSWEWPQRSDAHLGKAFIPPSSPSDLEIEHYGSLPSVVVEQHETRIEEIRDGMDSLGVEDLKEHVLNAHIPSRSRPSSSNSTVSIPPPLSYVQLSDFTAVITATILRVLPILSRLNSLLSTWDVRLLVLRQIPGLLRSLALTRAALDEAFVPLKSRDPPTEKDALYSRTNFYAKQAELGAVVASAGRRMDNVLDALEGREDSLPENWIDDLEAIEADFGTWAVEAEKRSAENEWLRINARTITSPDYSSQSDETPHVSEPTTNESESMKRNARAPLMETITEEPAICTPVPGHETVEKPESGSRLVEPPCPVKDAPDVSQEYTTSDALDRQVPLDENKSSPKASIPIGECSGDPTCSPQNKELSPDSKPETAIPSLPADQPNRPSVAGFESELEPELSPVHAQDLDQPNTSSSQVNVSPSASSPEPSSDSPPNVSDIAQVPSPVTEPVDGLRQTGENDLVSNQLESSKVSESNSNPGSSNLGPELRPVTTEEESAALASVVAEAATDVPASGTATRKASSSDDSMSSLPQPSKPCASSNIQNQVTQPLNQPDDATPSPKQPLESPIKMSKTRYQSSDKQDKHRRHRSSNASLDSLSDYPSLTSSPDIREPQTGSSNGTPLFVDTPPQRVQPGPAATHHDHTLREDRLRRFDNQKASPHMGLGHNRAVSLPLQRFINERLDMHYDSEGGEIDSPSAGRRPSTASNLERQDMPALSNKVRSSTPTDNIQRLASHRLGSPRETKHVPRSKTGNQLSGPWEHKKKAPLKNLAQRALNSQPSVRSATSRLSKELKTYPSQDSLGGLGRNQSRPSSRASTPADLVARKSASRPSTPSRMPKRKDHLDEKVSTILDALPGRIQLLSHAHEDDASSVASSVPFKPKERQRTVSRSGTPAPSLTLTPALSRRRPVHAHGPEESSVKLYHLHQGGKTNPTKLFVRSVGENGERVMVRVGGGWADLGEYLREYVAHHGRRHVSETPRVEVQGISRDSPAHSSPGTSMLTPTANNGRSPPDRPRSVLSNRPSSSLAVRKTRRASNVSDATDTRAASFGEPTNASYSPKSSVSARRLSVSSNNSAGARSMASDAQHGPSVHSPATPIAAGSARSTPLGLAGPKPRSRRVSMSPESEAWVEDVLGQARRSSSLRPVPFGIPPVDREATDPEHVPALPKVRSVSDMGTVGTSRRVVLRGLGGNGSRRSSKQG